MKKSLFWIFFAALAGSAFAAGTSSVTTAVPRVYKIATADPWIAWAPLHVADQMGFFKKNGIDLKVARFTAQTDVIAAVQEKRVDLGFDMIGSIAGFLQEGTPIVIVAETDWSHGGDKIIGRKDLDLASLKGKNVGLYQNKPAVLYVLNLFFEKNGLQLGDCKILEFTEEPLVEEFVAGRLPLIVHYEPHALKAIKDGKGVVLASTSSYDGCMPEGLFGLKDVVSSVPKADLAGILKSWAEAVLWAEDKKNWVKYQEILDQKTFAEGGPDGKPYLEKDLLDMLSNVRIHNPKVMLERNKTGGGLQKYLDSLKTFMDKNKLTKKPFTSEEIFQNAFVIEGLSGF